jgi:hypothetical protein
MIAGADSFAHIQCSCEGSNPLSDTLTTSLKIYGSNRKRQSEEESHQPILEFRGALSPLSLESIRRHPIGAQLCLGLRRMFSDAFKASLGSECLWTPVPWLCETRNIQYFDPMRMQIVLKIMLTVLFYVICYIVMSVYKILKMDSQKDKVSP